MSVSRRLLYLFMVKVNIFTKEFKYFSQELVSLGKVNAVKVYLDLLSLSVGLEKTKLGYNRLSHVYLSYFAAHT